MNATDTTFYPTTGSVKLRPVASRAEADAAIATGQLWMGGELLTDTEVDDMTFGMASDQYAVPVNFDANQIVNEQAAEIRRLTEINERLTTVVSDARFLAKFALSPTWPRGGEDIEQSANRVLAFTDK